jgi:hypothetical protein
MTRTALDSATLKGGDIKGLVPNAAFAMPMDAGRPRHPLNGVLATQEVPLAVTPASVAARPIMGGRIDRFPAVEVGFLTEGTDLIPTERGLIAPRGGISYWHVRVGPGRIWSEPGDGGATRAAFPFALAHPNENDTHHGLATLLIEEKGVTDLHLQIVQRTAPFLLPGPFTAWGRVPVRLGSMPRSATVIGSFAAERSGRLPVRPWRDLENLCEASVLGAIRQGRNDATAIVHALVVDGTVYAEPCRTEAGAYPYPEAMGFGVWSVTKTAAAMLTALRLAAKYGDEVFQTRVADVVMVTARHDGWTEVTLADCLDMATGIGHNAPVPEPIDIAADNVTEIARDPEGAKPYDDWYRAPTRTDRLHAAFAVRRYPWAPGRFARYRDQDIFMAGVVMDTILKRREGPRADVWSMMREEVFGPIGVPHATTTLTTGANPVPIYAFGLFLTLDEAAKIAGLLQAGGRHGAEQILSAAKTSELLGRTGPAPRPTGRGFAHGPVGYRMATWYPTFKARDGRAHRIPTMSGYGGNIVAMPPNGIIGLRFAHDTAENVGERWDPTAFATIAEAIRPF